MILLLLKNYIPNIACILFIVAIYGCSTKVNKFPNRAYHNINTKFNVLYHGELSFNTGKDKLVESYVEDYDELLPIFIFPNDSSARDIYPEMDTAIVKAEKAIQRHSMYVKKKERNKYIDETYLLMGKAHFYKRKFTKAFEMFKYVSKAYEKDKSGPLGQIWTAATYLETNKLNDAAKLLREIESNKKLPEEHKSFFKAVNANYYIITGNYSLAITELKEAVESTKNKKEKIRYNYIIAQLYGKLGDNGKAVFYYDEVLALKPIYEIVLNAKASKAVTSEGKNVAETEQELLKLLRRSPPGSQKSKIYIALAELELKRGKFKKAQSYISEAINNAEDKKTKKKAYLKMAQYYYDSRDYINAKSYYDSTFQVVTEIDKDYEEIESKKSNLNRLVKNLDMIHRQDSLRELANMSEDQRLAVIKDRIAENKAKAKAAQKKKEAEELIKANQNNGLNAGGSNGKWYFYNEPAIAFGKQEFKKVWGDRKLEDNWRRKNKSLASFDDAFANSEETKMNGDKTEDISAYLAPIPLTPEKMSTSIQKTIYAYYDLGITYSEKINEPETGIEDGFDVVINKYDTSKYAPTSAYYAYSIYTKLGYTDKANKYKTLILNNYPKTEYAEILKDPNYFKNKEKEANAIYPAYESAYSLYKSKQYDVTISKIDTLLQQYPENVIEAKFILLKALAYRGISNKNSFESALKVIIKDHPKSKEASTAKELLDKSNDPNYFANKTKELLLKKTETPYTYSDSSKLQAAIAFPLNGENKASNFKIRISNFNNKYFRKLNLKLSDLIIQEGMQMILIKSLNNSEDGIDYFKTFNQNKTELKGINDKGFYFFLITDENLPILIKNKDLGLYNTFFKDNYKF